MRASDGDGTVPLLSLGALCARHWREPRLNPSGMRVVTREFPHEPFYGLGELRCAPAIYIEAEPGMLVGFCANQIRKRKLRVFILAAYGAVLEINKLGEEKVELAAYSHASSLPCICVVKTGSRCVKRGEMCIPKHRKPLHAGVAPSRRTTSTSWATRAC